MGNCVCTQSKKSGSQPTKHNPKSTVDSPSSSPAASIQPQTPVMRNSNKKLKVLNRAVAIEDECPEAENAIITIKNKNSADKALIRKALMKHFIFNSLSEDHVNSVIGNMKHFQINANKILFEQNSQASFYFIVNSGKLEVLIQGQRKTILRKGDSFGELALIHDDKRTATIQSLTSCSLWGLDRGSFRNILESLNQAHYMENRGFLESIPMFQGLTHDQKETLLHALVSHQFESGQNIINEGDPGDLFYIIQEGVVKVSKNGKEIRQMTKGQFFGEQALLYNCVRTATIQAASTVKCLSINRETLNQVLGNQLQLVIYHNSVIMAVEQTKYISRLTPDQLQNVLEIVQVQSFKDQEVIAQGFSAELTNVLWIVLKGKVVEVNKGTQFDKFKCLNERLFISGPDQEEAKQISFVALGKADIALIEKADFQKVIGGEFFQITNNNEAVMILKQIEILRGLSVNQLEQLRTAFQILKYRDGEEIVQQGAPGDAFYIIKQGKVNVVKDGIMLRQITKHDYFGERALLFNETRSASVIAHKNVQCWMLHKDAFMSILGEDCRQLLEYRISLQDDNVQFRDLKIVQAIGSGMFGNVFLTYSNASKRLYALKTIKKAKVESLGIFQNVIQERQIMLQVNHPFIVKLIKTFRDRNRVYFLMEFIHGKDLFDALRDIGLLNEANCKFYVAIILTILEHLHERNIIYRDLKPENIIVDADGYLKLIDFGTSKIVEGRTYTTLGTPHYMAPEVILGKGYSHAVDIWGLGIMMYEFLCGKVPFGEEEDEAYLVYERILAHRLTYPDFIQANAPFKVMIEKLLNKNPAIRSGGSIANLKKMQWLGDINWDDLILKRLAAPYKPKLTSLQPKINQVLKKSDNIIKVIEAEESKDHSHMGRSSNPAPLDWDKEFTSIQLDC